MKSVPHVTSAQVLEGFRLRLTFEDATSGDIDLVDELWVPCSSRCTIERSLLKLRWTRMEARSYGRTARTSPPNGFTRLYARNTRQLRPVASKPKEPDQRAVRRLVNGNAGNSSPSGA